MQNTIRQYLGGVANGSTRRFLQIILDALGDRYSSVACAPAGLLVSATGTGVTAKIGATAFVGFANGVPVSIAASTDMPALVGVITAASFNVFAFFIDSASVVTVAMGVEGTTLAKVKFPPIPAGKAIVGFLVVTYASTFTGGTTPLATATTIYCSPTGAFDPSVMIA